MRLLILSLVLLASQLRAASEAPVAATRASRYFEIGVIQLPGDSDPQIGGIDALPNGQLMVSFHRGEVMCYDPRGKTWKLFASGLHEPLGVLVEPDGSVLVMQRPELTRLRDTDGDGVADRYETVWDGFGLSGNYHEFAFGPVRAADGRVFVSLNLASNGSGIYNEIRGAWSPVGMPRERFEAGDWKGAAAKEAGRMFSRVPWRGWVMAIDVAKGEATPWAAGFRSPDGLGVDAAGRLFVSDNQGDWRGTSEVHVVPAGGFHGNPGSLVWRRDWDGTEPMKVPVERLNTLRTRAAINVPYGTYGNSPTQIVTIPSTPAWGPWGGQLLMGEMNESRLFRLLPEEVDGVWQGACVALVDAPALRHGLHRLAFVGDTLYIGHQHQRWVGGEGLSTLRPTGAIAFDVVTVHLGTGGFRFEFTRPLSAAAATSKPWRVRRYRYAYHAAYGSPELDRTDVAVGQVKLSADAKTAELKLPELAPDFIYDFDLSDLAATDGENVLNPHLAYTVNRLVPATPPNTLTGAERVAGWTLLWDGHSFTGWRQAEAGRPASTGWSIAEGVLTVEPGSSTAAGRNNLLTTENFSAFELSFEFLLTPAANSGVKYLVQNVRNGARLIDVGAEYQLLDDERHPDAKRGVDGDRTLGSFYDVVARRAVPTRGAPIVGAWQHGRIVVRPNGEVEHWLNGEKIVEYVRSSPDFHARVAKSAYAKFPLFGEALTGPILLQDHGDRVSFRSLKVKRLSSDTPAAVTPRTP